MLQNNYESGKKQAEEVKIFKKKNRNTCISIVFKQ